MFKGFDLCLPTKSTIVPSGPDWHHQAYAVAVALQAEAGRMRS